jgi:hypothetical protein
METFCLRLAILRRNGLAHGWTWLATGSKTPGHFHVTVFLPQDFKRVELLTRVLLAALLGSDGVRETLNYCRVATGRRIPVAFFEERKP